MATPETTTSVQTTDSATGSATSAVATKSVKPGYQTTEFYLTLVAMLLSSAYASGLISPASTSTTAKAIALLAAALTTMGYTVSRGAAKK